MAIEAKYKHILPKIGDRIRDVRRSKNITQEDLADLAHIDRSYMGRVERGERNMSMTTLFRIAKALKVDSCELLPF